MKAISFLINTTTDSHDMLVFPVISSMEQTSSIHAFLNLLFCFEITTLLHRESMLTLIPSL